MRIGGGAVRAAFAFFVRRLIVGVALHRLGAFAAVLFLLLILIVVGGGVLRIRLLIAGVFGGILAASVAGVQVQGAQHLVHLAGEGFLIAGGSGQGVQPGAGLGLDIGAH